jgi:gliding motility-associated-like protein
MKKQSYYSLRIYFLFLLLLSIPLSGYAQTGCPSVLATGATNICPGSCTTLSSTLQATLGTTNYTVASEPYAPYSFTAGTTVLLGIDDMFTSVIPIPFNFCFYGQTYNQLVIGANGDITFDLTQAGLMDPWNQSAGPAPNSAYPMNIMCPYHDIDPALGGTITWAVYGTAPCRQFVINWATVPMFSCTTEIATQQCVLNETTNYIDVYIQDKPLCSSWNNGAAILGIQNTTYTTGVFVTGRNGTQWSATNEGWRFSPSGTPSYTFNWHNGATALGSTPTISVCPTATTTYTATLVNTNCDGTIITLNSTATVNVGGTAVAVTPPTGNVCPGGTITLTASGATTYTWSPSATLSASTGASVVATPTATTTYTVTGNSAGCSGTATSTITFGAGLNLALTHTDVSCTGALGTATVVPSGGAGPFTYTWTPSGGNGSTATNLAAGTYTVNVSNASGCASSTTVTILQPPPLSVSVAGINTSCNGGCDGQLICIPAGGSTPYTYSWSSGCTTAGCNNVCAGAYSITITDANGCTITGSTTVTQPTPLVLSMTSTGTHCNLADGADSVSVSGGTAPYTYAWSPGPGSTTQGYPNLATGNYLVIIHDAKNCVAKDSNAVSNSLPAVVASVVSTTPITCFRGSNGGATVAAAGGTAPYQYSWSPGAVLTASLSNQTAGIYTCTVTDVNGCSGSVLATITQPQVVTVTPMPAVTICISQSTPLTAQGAGGTLPYTYSWINAAGNPVTPPVSPLVSSMYMVICTDANGCASSPQSVQVIVNPPIGVTTSPNVSVCPGGSVQIIATATGGNSQYTYSWTPTAGLSNTNTANPTATPLTTVTYTVVATDNCGTPIATATVTVSVFTPPVISFKANDTTGCAPLCVDFTPTSTPACQSAVWQFGDGNTGSGCGVIHHCYPTAMSYSVTLMVTDIHSCVSTITKPGYITVFPLPQAAFSATPQTTSIVSPTIVFADQSTGSNNRLWSFGDIAGATDSTLNTQYTYPDTGCYKVTLYVKNAFGCKDSTSSDVCINPEFTFYAPDAFTPNGDGINDIWVPKGIGMDPKNYTLYIFDRWGNQLFQSTVWEDGWDGRANHGVFISQVDTYVWAVHVKDFKGNKHVFTGMVNLLK